MPEPNPFRPSFGSSPPLLAGRATIVDEVDGALADGVGAPGRASLITGPRGSGKTALLNAIEDRAMARGWRVISEDASGLMGRLPAVLAEHLADELGEGRTHLIGVSLPGSLGGVEVETTPRWPHDMTVRSLMEQLLQALARRAVGLLVTVDEAHPSAAEDLRPFGQLAQHMRRRDREFAFVGAGLPVAVSDLLNDDVLTFLRRAERFEVGSLNGVDAAAALRVPIEERGRQIDAEALAQAVAASHGFPFYVQLVGHRMWRAAADSRVLSVDHATVAIEEANARMGALVHEPAVRALSEVDRRFLAAMAMDDGPSRVADLAQRLDVGSSYISVYRARLIDEGMIQPAGHGLLDYTGPYLREFLRDTLRTGSD